MVIFSVTQDQPAVHPLLCFSVECLQLFDLPLCNSNIFSDLRPFTFSDDPCVFAMFAFVHALRLHTDLYWHKIAVNVLLCYRDLEDFPLAPVHSSLFQCSPRLNKLRVARPPFSANSHPS